MTHCISSLIRFFFPLPILKKKTPLFFIILYFEKGMFKFEMNWGYCYMEFRFLMMYLHLTFSLYQDLKKKKQEERKMNASWKVKPKRQKRFEKVCMCSSFFVSYLKRKCKGDLLLFFRVARITTSKQVSK